MFWFAAVLQKIRKVLPTLPRIASPRLTLQLFRKGVLFFIRDPAERSYNPVQEILERPASSQIRKVSSTLYSPVLR